ncbi:acetyltransferase (GNAT) family protein [Tumebacillus sp. BK434]|nr:acetyltransferase (GNAT) family protein [Tumebacillus sp. BK434]
MTIISTLSQLAPEQQAELAHVIKESWRKLYINLGTYTEAYETDENFWGLPMIQKELTAGNRWLVALEAGQCIAAVLLEATDDSLMLRMLGVHPDHQGRSLAITLIDHAGEIARREHYPKLTLFTSGLLTGLVAFYKRIGFTETRREPVSRFGLQYDRVFFEKY